MVTRQLGQTDLAVSALCFGVNVFGWTIDERGSFAVLDTYLDGGGNFIDTADVYGQGTSEIDLPSLLWTSIIQAPRLHKTGASSDS
jgi:aryl-alcohol dehydrogenase-like predicted oxidoreductase